MSRTFKGWCRLGVVLSVLWLVVAGGIVSYSYFNTKAQFNTPPSEIPPPLTGATITFMPSTFAQCLINSASERTCALKGTRIVVFELAPVVAGWAIVVLLVIAVRWVRAGFRGTQT